MPEGVSSLFFLPFHHIVNKVHSAGRASSPEPHTSTQCSPISPRPTTERTSTADSGFSEGTGKKFFSHVDKSMTSINSSGVRSIVGDDIVIA